MNLLALLITMLLTAVATIAAYQGSRLHSKAERLMNTEPSIAVLTINLTHGIISLSLVFILIVWLWLADQDAKFVLSTPIVLFFLWDLLIMGFLIRWCVMTRAAVVRRLRGECLRVPCQSCPVRDGTVHLEIDSKE